MFEIIPFIYFSVFLIIAVISDLRWGKIPNWITFPAMTVALLFSSYSQGWNGFLICVAGILVGMLVLIIPYALGGLGAGDVKLMGAIGGFLGPQDALNAFLCTALVGGGYALVVLAWKGYLKVTLYRYGRMLRTFFYTREILYIPPPDEEAVPKLRYGLAIVSGTVICIAGIHL